MWWLAAGLALAEIPLPSWKEERVRAEWHAVDAALTEACQMPRFAGQAVACTPDRVRAAQARAQAFQATVVPDAGLQYLIALGHRWLGEDEDAIRAYEATLALDDADVAAWYDLGELRFARGELDAARAAFTRVSDALVDDPRRGMLGPWRLAEVAAAQHDTAEVERQLKEALRRGFSFRQIEGLPNWKAYLADPALTDTLEKLITVYGDRAILDTLR